VWLDRGELDKIIERSATSAPAAPSAPYRGDRDRSDDDYRKYKKRNVWKEIFDF
jgi:hypothetical protein